MLINPQPVQASTIAGEPCLIWWVDKTQEGWPVVATEDLASCPHSCFVGIAGDFHNQSDTWCADLTPPPNLPGVYLGNACSADSSRSVTLLTDGTFGTNFEIEGNGQVVAGTSHTFTGIPEGLFTARGQAHNSNGSSGWSSPVSAQHDYSAPVTNADVVGLSQNGWYVSPVSVSFNANDVGCFGVNQTLYAVNGVQNAYTGSPFTIADDGIHTLQYRSTDGYHLEAEKSGIIPIDSTAPNLQFVLDRPQDVAGWWTAPLSIHISADDATSGLASLEYDLNYAGWVSGDSLILTDGVHTLDAQATDNAGHVSYDGVILPIDSTPPTLNVQITGEQGDNSWFIAPPTLTLSATDATSGVAGVLYQVENGSQTLYTAPLRFTREGLYTVQTFAVDNAQHITTRTVQIGYDITPPQTNATLTETEDGMTITLNRWDGVSGFALTRMAINGVWGDYHAPVTVTETGEYWVQFYTIDFAGNIEAEKIVSFTIAETGVVVTQIPPVVNVVPPANPPNTPPFETREDFPPNLHDEGVYFTYPEDNRIADTSTPPQTVATGDTANGGSSVVPMENNRISRNPRPIVDESVLPNVNSVPQPNVVYANSPNIIQTLQNLDVPESQTAPATIQTASISTNANNPINGALATLATLGIITAGAGAITMTATALAKKREQDELKSAQIATLQAQQSAQAQSASANWAENQAMQANAKQAVVTQVTQSQAFIDFQSNLISWAREIQLRQMLNQLQGTIFDVPNELNDNVKLAVFRIKQAWDRATQSGLMSSSTLLSHLPTLQSCFTGGVVNSSILNSLITTIYNYNLNTNNLASGSDEEKIALSRLFASNLHITAYLDEIAKKYQENLGNEQIKSGLDAFNQYFTQTIVDEQTYPVTIYLGSDIPAENYQGEVPLHQSNDLVEDLTSIHLGVNVSVATIVHEFFHQLDRHWGRELMSGTGAGSFDEILQRIPNVLIPSGTESLSFSSIAGLLDDVRANDKDLNEEEWADMGMIAVFHDFNLNLMKENIENGRNELDDVIRLGELDAYQNISENKIIQWTTQANFVSIENAFREFLIDSLGLTGVLP